MKASENHTPPWPVREILLRAKENIKEGQGVGFRFPMDVFVDDNSEYRANIDMTAGEPYCFDIDRGIFRHPYTKP